jgi:hypothetical protein
LIALPPGARATVRVIDAGPEDVRSGVRLVVGAKPAVSVIPYCVIAFAAGLPNPIAWGVLGFILNFIPYIGALFIYYYFYCDEGAHEQGTIGLSGEAGIAYLVSDYMSIMAGMQAETTVADGKVDIGGATENLRLNGIGLTIGMMITF